MIRRLLHIGPRSRPMIRFAVMSIVLAVLEGLLLASLIPIFRALVRTDPDYTAALPWLSVAGTGLAVFLILSAWTTPVGFAASNDMATHIRHRLMRHLTSLPLGWFDAAHKTAAVRSVSVASHMSTMCVVVGGPVITAFCVPVTLAIITFAVDWRLALVFVALLPLAALLLRWARRTARTVIDDMDATTNEIVDQTLQFGRAQPVLRAAGVASSGTPSLQEAIEEHTLRYRKGLNRTLTVDLVYTGAITVGFALVLVLAGSQLLGGNLAATDAIVLLIFAVRFLEPMGSLSGLVSGLAALDVSLRYVEDILHAPSLPVPEKPRQAGGDTIALDGVTFGYARSQRPALDNVSFTCPAGSTTALIGPSGSGKTTVVRLISRFTDPGSGTVRIGGVDVREQDPQSLLAKIAIVFQDTYLFDASIEENLRVALPDARPQDLADAAARARLDEVVDRLPDGWHTQVGEGGLQLSGGERQRVAIARAFLKNAPIVLIDEATSALDAENERAISQALLDLANDPERTVIVIAHRPATLQAADFVVALEAGAISESGSPGALITGDGVYARLHAQAESTKSWRIHNE